MAHAHLHADGAPPPASARARRLLTALLVPIGLATLAGLVVLWPGEVPDLSAEFGTADDLLDARVVDLASGPCAGTPEGGDIRCVTPSVELLDGPDAGRTVVLPEQSEGPQAITFEVGETIVVGYYSANAPEFQYDFADRERLTPLAVLGVLFVVAVVLLGRLQGLRALLALAITFGVLVGFILPAVIEGQNSLAVALVGSSVIAFVSLYLAHGPNVRTTTALLGSLLSLVLVGVLGAVFVALSNFSGLADEDALFLTIASTDIDLRGLLLGGLVIGALGVLDDVTITQASAVWELHAANPRYGRLELFRSAIRIGRDHIASTVNTLVLAYAGASLPLFLIFLQVDAGLLDTINGEVVAVEVVRTLCGSIGLVAAVPLTTALAALVVVGPSPRPPADAVGDGPAAGDGDGDGEGEPDEGVEPVADRPAAAPSTDPTSFRSRSERRFWSD